MTPNITNNLKETIEAERDFVLSIIAPLSWNATDETGQYYQYRNGTVFFLNTGERTFGVTANHVIQQAIDSNAVLRLLNLKLDLNAKNKIIDRCSEIDIATFEIDTADIQRIDTNALKQILEGINPQWPPTALKAQAGVYTMGFPNCQTATTHPREPSFGAVSIGGLATSINSRDVTVQIERNELIDMPGTGTTPENFNYSGISGAPLLVRTTCKGILGWSLAGVIYEGPNTDTTSNQSIQGLELVKARKSSFLLADGTLDRDLWRSQPSFPPSSPSAYT